MGEEERQLIRRLAAGDRAAGSEFVELWHRRIVRWIMQRAPRPMAGEYAQEVWWHLIERNWRRLLKWDGLYNDEVWHENSLRGFLKRLTNNKVYSLMRAERRQLPLNIDPADIVDEDGPLGADPQVQAERAHLISVYYSCVSHLNDRDKRLLEMCWKGHSAAEIGAALNMRPNNVYQRKKYVMDRIRDCLIDKLPEHFHHV